MQFLYASKLLSVSKVGADDDGKLGMHVLDSHDSIFMIQS